MGQSKLKMNLFHRHLTGHCFSEHFFLKKIFSNCLVSCVFSIQNCTNLDLSLTLAESFYSVNYECVNYSVKCSIVDFECLLFLQDFFSLDQNQNSKKKADIVLEKHLETHITKKKYLLNY